MKFLCLALCGLFMISCANKKETMKLHTFVEPIVKYKITTQKSIKVPQKVADLQRVSQNVENYLHNIPSQYISTQKKYEKDFFQVWNRDKIKTALGDAMWAYKAFSTKNSYGENLQKLTEDFFDFTRKNSNFKEYATINKQAVSLKELNIRAFPSDQVLFLNPSKAGEGFPFDYLQNSTISPNKPLLLSHYSKDRAWVFIESSFAFGWVKSDEVVILDKKYSKLWQKAKQVIIIKEGIPIYTTEGDFLFQSKIGMMLPLIEENSESYTVLSITKYKSGKALYRKSKLSKKIAHLGILEFNAKNIAKILNEVAETNYGWGGIYSQRDCSSTLRDFYASFGLWLPRNSYKQSTHGKRISLENLNIEEKITKIKKEAIPFKTLLYKKGHIVMYVGVVDDEIIIFQNVWGVKTRKNGKEGRFVIGRPVFSTLEIGKNLKYFDTNSSLLLNLKSMTKL